MPDYTGSGKYIQEIIRQCDINGHQNYLLAGAKSDFSLSETLIAKKNTRFVRFEGRDIVWPIPGMSDVMPYPSSRFSSLDGDQLRSYNEAFKEKIRRAIDQFKPDLVHSHHLWIVSAISKSLLDGTPQVTTCHGTCLRQHYLCPNISGKIRTQLNQIDQVIALSVDQKENIVKTLGIDSTKIEVISGGFNQDCFYPAPKPEDGIVELMYAGKLSESKGVPWLLRSLEIIKNTPFMLHLAGSGSGEEKELCLALAKDLGAKVKYHGPLSHEKLGDLMRQCHIFILPSFYEGVPLVLIEALACGCKIVATSLPGVKQILGTKSGDHFELINLPELETIDKPFEKDLSNLEDQFSILLKKCIEKTSISPQPEKVVFDEIATQYTWSKLFNKIKKIYKDLTSKSQLL